MGQEPIQAGEGLHHPDPMTHHQDGTKGTPLVFKEVSAVHVLHTPVGHDLHGLGMMSIAVTRNPFCWRTRLCSPVPAPTSSTGPLQ